MIPRKKRARRHALVLCLDLSDLGSEEFPVLVYTIIKVEEMRVRNPLRPADTSPLAGGGKKENTHTGWFMRVDTGISRYKLVASAGSATGHGSDENGLRRLFYDFVTAL
jgi:hypothetical protein